MAWIHSILFLMEPCNLVSKVKTWTSPHQVAVHLLQPRARVLQWFNASTLAPRFHLQWRHCHGFSQTPQQLQGRPLQNKSDGKESLHYPEESLHEKPFFILFPVVCSSSVPTRLMAICQFYNNGLTFGKIGTTNITFCFIFKCLRIFYKSSSDSDRIWFCVGEDKYTSRPRTPSGNRSSLPELVALT